MQAKEADQEAVGVVSHVIVVPAGDKIEHTVSICLLACMLAMHFVRVGPSHARLANFLVLYSKLTFVFGQLE